MGRALDVDSAATPYNAKAAHAIIADQSKHRFTKKWHNAHTEQQRRSPHTPLARAYRTQDTPFKARDTMTEETTTPKVFKLYPKKYKLALGAFGTGSLFVLAAVAAAIGPSGTSTYFFLRDPILYYGVMALAMAVFGFLLFFSLKNLRDPKPWVILTDDTVETTTFNLHYTAPWQDFNSIVRVSGKRSNMLVLRLRDPQAYLAQLPSGRKKTMAKALINRFESPFLVDLSALNIDAYQVVLYLQSKIQPDPEPAETNQAEHRAP